MENNRDPKNIETDDLDRMCNILLEFFHASKIVLTKSNVTVEKTHELISSITEIRSLLSQWGRHEEKIKRDASRISTIAYLEERYLELEGMVKELRDDLRARCKEQSQRP